MGWENARRIFRAASTAWLIFAAVCASTPAIAAAQGSAQSTMETRAALLERDVADLRSNTPLAIQASKDVIRVEVQQHEVNTRVDDLKARIGDLTIAISLIAPFLTMLGIIAGWFAYSAAGQRAETAAKAWMKEQGERLLKRIDELEVEAGKSTERMAQQVEDVAQRAKGAKDRIDEETDDIVRRLQSQLNDDRSTASTGVSGEPSAGDQKTMKLVDDDLKAKPEKDYTAEDWSKRAFAAFAESDFDRAAIYFQQAADSSGENSVAWVQFTVNSGIMLSRAGRGADAVKVYDAVVDHVGDAPDVHLRALAAIALNNKGLALVGQNFCEQAVEIFDDIVALIGDSAEPVLVERVAKALVNKGVALGKLNRRKDEIVTYESVIDRFGSGQDIFSQEAVARALVNKGKALGNLELHEEALEVFDSVKTRFDEVPGATFREQVAVALLCKGVALTKLRRINDALIVYDEIVKRFENGAEGVLRRIAHDAIKARNALVGA